MPSIQDRVGSQNVIRVLSNATAPPTKLVGLQDIDASNLQNGSVLVYDAASNKFVVTLSLTPSETQNLEINGGLY